MNDDRAARCRRFGISLAAALLAAACGGVTDSGFGDHVPGESRAPFLLTLDEAARWTADGPLADPGNVSSVPLAERFVDARSQLDPGLPVDAKVLIAPDGMDGLANYLDEQPRFNLYTFTHWSSIDSINWFGGTAELNVSIPSRPWVETAHRNGVKVLGTVFFAPQAWGGSAREPAAFLRRDDDGEFVYVEQLIRIARYYGFDGWLINQETDLSDADPALGEGFVDFMAALTARRPDGMEIHWYDSMLPGGKVAWQNELNARNARFLQDGDRRTSDAMFVNYWWNRQRVGTSVKTAASISRSPYDVYTGADLWPDRRAQGLSRMPEWLDRLDGEDGDPRTSVALFANNYNYLFGGSEDYPAESVFAADATDVAAFYRAANRLFGGDDGNPAVRDPAGDWPGIGSRFPARSTLSRLPFSSNFSTGHGKLKARQGETVESAWHDMAAQDMLPTWQFAVLGNTATQVDFDFERAYEKGNSLRVVADPAAGRASIPLYKTAFESGSPLTVEVVHALTGSYEGAALWLETAEKRRHRVALLPTEGEWLRSSASVDTNGERIIRVGIDLAAGAGPEATLHLGELSVRESGAAR